MLARGVLHAHQQAAESGLSAQASLQCRGALPAVCDAGAPCLQSAMRGRPACSLRCGGALPAQLCAGCVIPLSLRIVQSVPLLTFNLPWSFHLCFLSGRTVAVEVSLKLGVVQSAPGLITYGIAAVHTFVSGSPVPTVFVAFSNWIDCTAGEAVVAELAPELVPMLSALEMPANFVPVTNAVLSEMQRRGVARDQLLTALRRMGEDMPCASVAMLQVGAGQCWG